MFSKIFQILTVLILVGAGTQAQAQMIANSAGQTSYAVQAEAVVPVDVNENPVVLVNIAAVSNDISLFAFAVATIEVEGLFYEAFTTYQVQDASIDNFLIEERAILQQLPVPAGYHVIVNSHGLLSLDELDEHFDGDLREDEHWYYDRTGDDATGGRMTVPPMQAFCRNEGCTNCDGPRPMFSPPCPHSPDGGNHPYYPPLYPVDVDPNHPLLNPKPLPETGAPDLEPVQIDNG